MFTVEIAEKSRERVVLKCRGRLVRSQAAFRLKEAVVAEWGPRAIVVDLSQVDSVAGGGLGMLAFVNRWTLEQGIELEICVGSEELRQRLAQLSLKAIPCEAFPSSAHAGEELLQAA